MTTHDEQDNIGSLKAFLEGKDGVAATYRKVAGAEPPAELDGLILRAAADAVIKPAPQPDASRRQRYAMAASLGLGVLLTSLYYEQQVPQDTGPLVITASVDQRQVGELDFAEPTAADAGVANGSVADSAAEAETGQAQVAQAGAARAELQRAQAVRPTPQQTGTSTTAEESQQEVRPPPATRASETLDSPVARSLAELVSLAEQSRLNDSNVSAELRAQNLWLAEIMRIASELETSASETEALRQRLAAERESFSAIYPGFDLDAALAQ